MELWVWAGNRLETFPSEALPEDFPARAKAFYQGRPLSLFWEIRVLLYLGVLLLASGLGIWVYKHIDTLGHQALLFFIAAAAVACFGYSTKRAGPFTWGKPAASSSLGDYSLLLGALLSGIFVGYLQFQYAVFGSRHALMVGAPALFYLFLAYRYDHRGVLQMGISGLCAAVGLVVTPLAILEQFAFRHTMPVYLGLGLASAFALAAWISEKREWKSHFAFSYFHFALHLSMLAALNGMFRGASLQKLLFVLLILALAWGFGVLARQKRSHYFLLCAVVYAYAGITGWIIHLLFSRGSSGEGSIYALFLYFMLSCAGTILFFLNMKKILGIKSAGLSKD